MADATAATQGTRPLSWWEKIRSVAFADRAEAFVKKHPYVATAIVVGLAGTAFSAMLGLPALAAGAQTLATTVGLALEFGGLSAAMGGMLHIAKSAVWPPQKKTMLLHSGQVVSATPQVCRELSARQNQFDRLAARRDFNVKAELTDRDREALRAYEALWSKGRVSQWLAGRMAESAGVIKIAGTEELSQVNASVAAVGELIKNYSSDAEVSPLHRVHATPRAYTDEELAEKKQPEIAVAFGRKLQLVSKLV